MAPLAFPNLPTISLSAPPSDVTSLPRYVKWYVFLISFPLSYDFGEHLELRGIPSVYFMLMFRPILLTLLCKLDVFHCVCVSRWDIKAENGQPDTCVVFTEG